MSLGIKSKVPQDLVAIFHASFHPTQGNIIDWSLTASEGFNLDHLEYSALPSGLHLVDQDVVYFTKDGQHGVCVFRKRKSSEPGLRGFRLSSLGVLLAKSNRPRPWRHIDALKDLIDNIHSRVASSESLQPTDSDWDLARSFFEERKIRRADLSGAGDWDGWAEDFNLDNTIPADPNPTLHLPHLLRILGPSSLTLYKHVIGRRRILIYTLPPVEAACILCHAAADMCYEYQREAGRNDLTSSESSRRLKGRSKEPINVLGMITLNDLDRLHVESKTGRGWIACTTDAIFLEKPSYYDLLIDLTTSTPNKATRPSFFYSKPIPAVAESSRGPTHRLASIRFSWSDIKLWNEIDRILLLDSNQASHSCCGGPAETSKSKLASPWTDAWRVYEDVCVICAGLWLGSWRGNSTMSYSTADGAENWGAVRLEGDDDLTLQGSYVRNVGMGIEGGPKASSSAGNGNGVPPPSPKSLRRASAMSWSSGKATVVPPSSLLGVEGSGKSRQVSSSSTRSGIDGGGRYEDTEVELTRRDGQMNTTLALLQTFHAHTAFQVSVLESFLPRGVSSNSDAVVFLSPKDILAFELGPLSGFDARYLEWLAQEYSNGIPVVVKRGWKDLLSMIFGYA